MKNLLLILILLIVYSNTNAQILTRKIDRKLITGRQNFINESKTETIIMPYVDVKELLVEDEQERGLNLPFRFGVSIHAELDLDNSGIWTELPDGARIWALNIVSEGAYSISLSYKKFKLPVGSELYIYNGDKTVVQGPLNSTHNIDGGTFATDLIPGESIILEYYEPRAEKGKGKINIDKVIHGYKDIFEISSLKAFGDSGDCQIDVNCPEGYDWQDESNSVAMIIVGNDRICSGALINNTCQDLTPYFLTANHCLTGVNVSDFTFRFQYKSPVCGGGDDFSFVSYHGASLVDRSYGTDYALLELNSLPDGKYGIFLAGWSRTWHAPPSVTGIHHPFGDVMKIIFDDEYPTALDGYESYWFIDDWLQGSIERGSSGSPLFDHNRRIIGQASSTLEGLICAPGRGGLYGRFELSWDLGLSEVLDPNNTGAMTTNTISIPFVSGPVLVCSSNKTFSINNPTGLDVQWNKSKNLSYVSGQGTNSYTVKATNNFMNGPGWVEASIGTANCSPLTLRKTISVGNSCKPVIECNYPSVGMNSLVEAFAYSENASSYHWLVSGGTVISGQGTSEVLIRTSNRCMNDLYIRVKGQNECGESPYAKKYIPFDCSGLPSPLSVDPSHLSVSPNPSNGYLTVHLDLTNDETETSTDEATNGYIHVKLLNQNQLSVYSDRTRTKSFTVDVRGLQIGIYYLVVKYKGKEYTEKVIISDF